MRYGMPLSSVSSSAISSALASMRSASFNSSRARCAGVNDAQGGDSNALRAACTATSMSACPPDAARANTVSFAGSMTSKVSPDWAGCHRPAMNSSRGRAVKLLARARAASEIIGGGVFTGGPCLKNLEIVDAIAFRRLLRAAHEHVAIQPVVFAFGRFELRHGAHVVEVVRHGFTPRHLRHGLGRSPAITAVLQVDIGAVIGLQQ